MDRGRSRPGPARSVSEARIVEAALRLLDASGPAGLSVRGVAAEVGVTPNALYTYFPTKAALVSAVVDDLLGRVDVAVLGDAGRPWRDRLCAYALDLRAVLLSHPGVVPLLLGDGFSGPRALAAGEAVLELLVSAGLDAGVAARTSYLLVTYVLGTVALDVAELEPGTPVPDEGERTAGRRAALAGLPAGDLPRTAQTLDVIAAYNTTEQYRWGLERLLDGIGGAGPEDTH
ncbi:TetR/AcrR family transcriptional regulator [Geodermatophilus sp. SYSU D00700]